MIDAETVFIIGAGASKPYNFPTGRELRTNIINNFPQHIKMFSKLETPKDRRITTTYESFIKRFRESGIHSIDKYLSFNPNHNHNGKIAIAIEILRAESQSKFDEGTTDDWYSFLYNRMLEGISPGTGGHKEFTKNKVSFITFNYDRSLEWYLHRCFSNTFNENIFLSNSTAELLPFPIIHVYGAAKLPWQEHSTELSLGYQKYIEPNEISFHDVQKMAEQLRIIFDDRKENQELSEVANLLINANKIFFLGFGYADENLEILGIPDSINDKQIFGSAKGLTEMEIKKVLSKLRPGKNPIYPIDGQKIGFNNGPINLIDVDCLSLLREYL